MDIRPFRIAVEEDTPHDLMMRLSMTRFPDEVVNAGWDYGTNLQFMRLDSDARLAEQFQRNAAHHPTFGATLPCRRTIGAGITTRIAGFHPDKVIGICILAATPPYLGPGSPPLTEAEKKYIADGEQWKATEGAYAAEQSTKRKPSAMV